MARLPSWGQSNLLEEKRTEGLLRRGILAQVLPSPPRPRAVTWRALGHQWPRVGGRAWRVQSHPRRVGDGYPTGSHRLVCQGAFGFASLSLGPSERT